MRLGRKEYSWSFLGTFLGVAINLILLPFVIHYLNPDELGLWYVFASISTMILLLDFGFTPTIARNIAYSWSGAKNLLKDSVSASLEEEIDVRLFGTVLKSSKLIYLVLSLLGLFLMLVFGTSYISSIVSEGVINNWLAAWLFYAGAVFLNFFFAYISAYLRGIGAVAENSKVICASKITQLLVTLVLLFLGFGILGTAIGYFSSCIIQRALGYYYFKNFENASKYLEEIKRIKIKLVSILHMVKTIWHNAWRDGLVALAMFLSTQANTLICSSVLGLSSTGSYGLALQISTAIASVASVWYSASQPKLQEYAVKKESASAARLFATSMVMYCVLSIIAYAAFLLVGPPLLSVLNKEFNFDTALFAVMCVYMFLYRANVLFVSCISNFNTIPYSRAYVLTGLISVGLSFLCAKYTSIGMWSLVIPPLLVLLGYNGWKWPRVALDKLSVSFSEIIIYGKTGLKDVLLKVAKLGRH